jgi:type II secretory ATPase GspE/PulE/Tfp pilus assembly ATPase PilB-like protein
MDGDNGLLILCGPTGSGKTTTIYNILRSIDALKNNVLTAKSPIEVLLENVSQTQIDDDGVQLRDLGPRNPTSGARHRDDVSAIRSA